MNQEVIKKMLKKFTTNNNLQRTQPMHTVWEIYTSYYLPQPFESLQTFLLVFFEKEHTEIELLRKEKWGSIDFLTEKFSCEIDEAYEDEDLGICTQYLFTFYDEESVKAFLSDYETYIRKEILKK